MPLKVTATKNSKNLASMSTAPAVRTSVNVKSPPGVWGLKLTSTLASAQQWAQLLTVHLVGAHHKAVIVLAVVT